MQQKESAQSRWADFETEESIVPSLSGSLSLPSAEKGKVATSNLGRNSKQSQSRASQSHRPGASHATPAVEAARQRAKTMKLFKGVEAGLKKAYLLGESILNDSAIKVHGSQDRVWVGRLSGCATATANL